MVWNVHFPDNVCVIIVDVHFPTKVLVNVTPKYLKLDMTWNPTVYWIIRGVFCLVIRRTTLVSVFKKHSSFVIPFPNVNEHSVDIIWTFNASCFPEQNISATHAILYKEAIVNNITNAQAENVRSELTAFLKLRCNQQIVKVLITPFYIFSLSTKLLIIKEATLSTISRCSGVRWSVSCRNYGKFFWNEENLH